MARPRSERLFPILVLVLAGASPAVRGVPGGTEFFRRVDLDWNECRVETAVVEYAAGRGVAVTLVAAMHAADPRHFREVQAELDRHAVVLYEGWKAESPRGTLESDASVQEPLVFRGVLAAARWCESAVLALLAFDHVDQWGSIGSSAPRFVNADMTWREFAERCRSRSELLLEVANTAHLIPPYFGSFLRRSVPSTPRELTMLLSLPADSLQVGRYLFARETVAGNNLYGSFMAARGALPIPTVTIHERNAVVMEALDQEFARGARDIAIYYGGAHMPELEARLVARGFRRVAVRWLPCWDVRRLGESDSDLDRILDDLGRRAFAWFEACRHPATGQVLDRAPNRPSPAPAPDAPAMSSIAATGYFLSLLPPAVELGLIERKRAESQAKTALSFLIERGAHHRGLFYHFIDWRSGARWRQSEVSVLDTAILLNGAMVAGEGFGGACAALADQLLDRAEWSAFRIRDPASGRELLSLGWTPERGLLPHPAGVRTSEMAMPYFLAVGSRSHSIDPECWYRTEIRWREVAGRRVLHGELPLFVSYYGLGWHDLEGLADRDGIDLHRNAVEAALANRAFCRERGKRFPAFNEEEGGWWGISAGDGPSGYVAPGPVEEQADGTVWPLAALAALPFIPEELREDLPRWRASRAWSRAMGEFGLAPFRLGPAGAEWCGTDIIGIDAGSFAQMWMASKTPLGRKLWMRHPVARAAMERLGYRVHER